ncbi:POT family MFS transporter [Verrucomicrobiaceae bacterium R5-34]|uniref:POT family MFS transporter n=1 Tax=Oceaniferula flava TaxID=2800421 RepID=A0AAE2SCP2_9BACT|nr:POT family MFS transporter [Oceaniferula flavus]MBK1830392.1 POT family MFS transporter [Verrucomicrobiaceae bacterium R5-34]MBK1854484.1 POT family MFS transporter [Oceaniferula flavus]MBM1135790.1 POT family MFS transporter [Oceaniferula flavus]
MSYRSHPEESERMPGGIPYIISNEAAERFSFYGMKAALAIFLANYLGVLGGESMNEASATAYVSFFNSAVYLTPLLGALIADIFLGKYRTIITLSIVYCLGHLCLAFMGIAGSVQVWLLAGLGLISLGAGGIKPCVSSHVGDQFGLKNQHLLTKIFNIFYLSINFGAVISNLAIPWVLKWHGPHLAFGLPGILMVLATIAFWMGRNKFIHIPAHGSSFLKELTSREGLVAIGKLIPLFLFVAVFWCLFDQTASTLVFQAEKMDLNVFGIEVLPSQIQAANPFLILVLIPLFTWGIYPAVNKVIPLTPLRKVGAGLFIMAISFAIISIAQEAIDRGETPTVWWQLLAYLIFTSAEIMISIVCLEFAYTQAPRRMKSFVMAIFLVSVTVGNLITGAINIYIQIPEVALVEETAHAGYDGKLGSDDDLELVDGKITSPVTSLLKESAATIKSIYRTTQALPTTISGNEAFSSVIDPWGNPLRYTQISSNKARLSSDGPDKTAKTQWDLGIMIQVDKATEKEEGTWLQKEKRKLNMIEESTANNAVSDPVKVSYYAGGQTSLEGADYFWFFTKLMLVTAILFIPFSILYQPKSYLQE